ncbi:MAG TPA: hypothetical protein VLZ83_16900 [Edaphocola sp.]|nr:hypothetical protein [Edaphocola sp.]
MFWKFLILGVLFYWIGKFIIKFVLPISRVYSQMKKEVRNQQQNTQPQNNKKPSKDIEGEFIDYEEIK